MIVFTYPVLANVSILIHVRILLSGKNRLLEVSWQPPEGHSRYALLPVITAVLALIMLTFSCCLSHHCLPYSIHVDLCVFYLYGEWTMLSV